MRLCSWQSRVFPPRTELVFLSVSPVFNTIIACLRFFCKGWAWNIPNKLFILLKNGFYLLNAYILIYNLTLFCCFLLTNSPVFYAFSFCNHPRSCKFAIYSTYIEDYFVKYVLFSITKLVFLKKSPWRGLVKRIFKSYIFNCPPCTFYPFK